MNRKISLRTPNGPLHGWLDLPDKPSALILLIHSHHTPANSAVAAHPILQDYAVFAMELLSTREMQFVDATHNVPRLTQRLLDILDLVRNDSELQNLPLALFANGDTTPAALRAAAQRDLQPLAMACHGGIIDRAGLQALKLLATPLLLLFDSTDQIGQNACQRAANHLTTPHEMHLLLPGEEALQYATNWFSQHLAGRPQNPTQKNAG